MQVVIAGGTGQVGTVLARSFHARGAEVTVLGRLPASLPWRFQIWDGRTLGEWTRWIEGADVVINLAGRSVNCRYNAENRREIIDSRVHSTRVIGAAIAGAQRRRRFGCRRARPQFTPIASTRLTMKQLACSAATEAGAPDTWRFSIEVATAWERACDEAVVPQTRKVKMRSAMIMSPDAGGIFATLLRLVRLRLGGTAGTGRQFVSWIHYEDFIGAIDWLIAQPELAGAINLAAPHPLPYAAFMRGLRRAAGISLGLPAKKWMLEIGAFLMRTETELVLKSRCVVPGRLRESGFAFHFEEWPAAANDLCAEWRKRKAAQRS